MKVVPEDVLTCPLGTVREPQSTAVEYEHSGYSAHSHSCYSRAQVGASGVHCAVAPQVRVSDPTMLYPVLHVYVAVIMKVVPEDVFTAPLEGLVRPLQFTAV